MRTPPVPTPIPLSLFDRTVERSPASVALLDGNIELTYKQLYERSGRVAVALQAFGAAPGRTVGLCLERSSSLIASVLGILRTGAAYVPIDPTYPAERITGMLADAQPPVVLTERAHQHLFKGSAARVLLIEDLDLLNGPVPGTPSPATAKDLCYVLFTSGSTGRPKGVAMPNGPLANLLQWQLRTSILGADARTLQFAPISFDVSFQELFTTFAQGGTLVLITDEDRLNSTQLLRKIIAERIEPDHRAVRCAAIPRRGRGTHG
ncbi:MAG: AMP-binding protein [Flavobacteriales bacterium]